MLSFKILSLNVRGLRDDTFRLQLFNIFKRDYRDYIICLQETHCGSEREAVWWTKQWGGTAFWTTFSSTSHGAAILLPSKYHHLTLQHCQLDQKEGRYVIGRLMHKCEGSNTIGTLNNNINNLDINNNFIFDIVNVYAPNIVAERTVFFEHLQDILQARPGIDTSNDSAIFDNRASSSNNDDDDNSLDNEERHDASSNAKPPLVIVGDFNCVLDEMLDRVGSVRDHSDYDTSSVSLRALMSTFGLVDVWRKTNPYKKAVTWQGGDKGARLDRVLIPSSWLTKASNNFINTFAGTDHLGVGTTVSMKSIIRGSGYWKMNVSILNHNIFIIQMRGLLLSAISQLRSQKPDLLQWWDILKRRIRSCCMRYCAGISSEHKSKQAAAQERFDEAHTNWLQNPVVNQHIYKEERAQFEDACRVQYEGAAVRSRANWLVNGERCTSFFCRLEKERNQRSDIPCLLDEDGITELREPQLIKGRARNFYHNLYTPESAEEDIVAQDDLLSSVHVCLTEEESRVCEGPVTINEVFEAIKRAPKNKTPGLDGIPADFFKTFSDLLGPLLVDIFNSSLSRGTLSLSMREAVISIAFKKGDPRLISNYRPLSMLCADVKLLSSILTTRMRSVASSIIHPDQTGFMRGRHIAENILLVREIVRHCKSSKAKSILLFLDQEKAYDRVSWTFLFRSLQRFGFGASFMSWVRLLYTSPLSSVVVNGWRSSAFELKRGVRQGDPLSCLLYNVVDEVLACALRACADAPGLALPGGFDRYIKISQYADDKVIACSSDADAQASFAILSTYERAAGAKINSSKSCVLPLGGSSAALFPSVPSSIAWLDEGEPVKHLGVLVGNSISLSHVWQECVGKMTKTLALWSRRPLTLAGRVVVLKSLATSRLWHIASTVAMPKEVLKLVVKALWRFLWNGKDRGVVSREVCYQHRVQGGLGVPNVELFIRALHLTWLRKLVDSTFDAKWKDYILHDLRTCNFASWWGLGDGVILADAKFRGSGLFDSFWEEILDTFDRLHGSESSPKSYWEVVRSPLWYNPLLTDRESGSSFGSKATLYTARSGIVRMCDIWDGDLCCWKTAKACGLRQDLFQKLTEAVPDSWLQYLRQGPGDFKVGDWLRFKTLRVPGDVYHVVKSSSSTTSSSSSVVCVHVHSIDVSSTICSNHHCTLNADWLVNNSVHLLPFRATFSPSARGYIYEGRLDELTIIPENVFVDQVDRKGLPTRCSILKSTVRGSYSALLHNCVSNGVVLRSSFDDWSRLCAIDSIPWKKVWRLVWQKHVDVSTRDFLWRLVMRALWVGSRFQHWAPERSLCRCCDSANTIETFEHLFVNCSGVLDVWTWMRSLILKLCGVQLDMSVSFICLGLTNPCRIQAQAILCNVVRSECLKAIWHFRNQVVHDNKNFTCAGLLNLAKNRVSRHLSTLISSYNIPTSSLKDLCQKAIEDVALE